MSNIVSGVTLLSICSQQWSLCETSPCGSGKALPWEAPAETLAQPPPDTCCSTANPMLLPDREPNSAQHPLMDDPGGWSAPVPASLEMLPPLAATVQGPCISLFDPVSFFSLSKTTGTQPSLFHLIEQTTVQTQLTHSPMGQARMDRSDLLFACKIFPHCHQLLPQDAFPPPQVSTLCSGTLQTNMVKSSWMFTQQSWPALHECAAEACPGWSGLPLVASTLREEKMPLIWTSIFSSCHRLPTSYSCHFPLAIRQPDSA